MQRCMSVPRQRLGAAGKLHHVLQPKLTQPPRSTKPLTLPEDLQLRTSSRLRSGARQQAPQQQPELVSCIVVSPAALQCMCLQGGMLSSATTQTAGTLVLWLLTSPLHNLWHCCRVLHWSPL